MTALAGCASSASSPAAFWNGQPRNFSHVAQLPASAQSAASFSRGDGSSDNGKWWVENDQLCQKWTSWMDGKQYCYKLTQQGASVRWVRNDGRSGTARIGG